MARRGGRGGRAEGANRPAPSAPAYVKRRIPFFEFLDEAGLAALERQADWLIEEIGLEFREDAAALETWRSAGAKVTDTRVRVDAAMVRELCKTAPSQFTQLARNPARSVTIGGSNQVFAPIYGAPFVRDLENGRRYGSIADFEKLVKLTNIDRKSTRLNSSH